MFFEERTAKTYLEWAFDALNNLKRWMETRDTIQAINELEAAQSYLREVKQKLEKGEE